MKPVCHFGSHYTEFFAWIPTRMTSGLWVWLDPYYIRPDHSTSSGFGLTLSFEEVRQENQ